VIRHIAPGPDGDRLRQLVNGYQGTQAIHAAVTLGVPDLLAGGARTSADLAGRTGTHEPSLYRLLRALIGLGILAEAQVDGVAGFELTDLGRLLRQDVPGSLAGWAAFVGRPYHWEAWGGLLHTVRTGEMAFAAQHGGEGVWEWRERHPEESRIFDRAMSAVAASVARQLVEGYDFSRFARIADIGGGEGTLLAAVLASAPASEGLVFDLPHVVARAPDRLEAAGVADRARVLGGSFFERVPDGYDAYVLKSILHDWDDPSSTAILQAVHRAAEPGATVVIVERIIAEDGSSTIAVMSDLNMMVANGGRERTMGEWRTLIGQGGFETTRALDIGLGWSAIEAVRRDR